MCANNKKNQKNGEKKKTREERHQNREKDSEKKKKTRAWCAPPDSNPHIVCFRYKRRHQIHYIDEKEDLNHFNHGIDLLII